MSEGTLGYSKSTGRAFLRKLEISRSSQFNSYHYTRALCLEWHLAHTGLTLRLLKAA